MESNTKSGAFGINESIRNDSINERLNELVIPRTNINIENVIQYWGKYERMKQNEISGLLCASMRRNFPMGCIFLTLCVRLKLFPNVLDCDAFYLTEISFVVS